MPLVRIDVQEGRTPEELRGIADTVQDVMLDVFAAPPGDRYQIITEHPVGHIIAEDTGLGIERSDGVTVIQIFQQGRSEEQKRAVYKALATRLHDRCGIAPASSRRGFDLVRVSARTGRERVLRHHEKRPFTSVVPSPDGRRVAFGQRADVAGLATLTATMPVAGGRPTVLHHRWHDVISWQACPAGGCAAIGAPRLAAAIEGTARVGSRTVTVRGVVTPEVEANPGELVSTLRVFRRGRWWVHDSQVGPMVASSGGFYRRLDRPGNAKACRVVNRFLGSGWAAPARQVIELDC